MAKLPIPGAYAPPREPCATLHSWPPPPAHESGIVPSAAEIDAEFAAIVDPPPSPPEPERESRKQWGIRALQRLVAAVRRDRGTTPPPSIEEPPPPPPASERRSVAVVVDEPRHAASDSLASIAAAAPSCAAILAGTLCARAVIVHAYDPLSGSFRVVAASGEWTSRGPLAPEDDAAAARHDGVAAARTRRAVPVMTAEGCVALIEIFDLNATLEHFAPEACQRAAETLARSAAARPLAS